MRVIDSFRDATEGRSNYFSAEYHEKVADIHSLQQVRGQVFTIYQLWATINISFCWSCHAQSKSEGSGLYYLPIMGYNCYFLLLELSCPENHASPFLVVIIL